MDEIDGRAEGEREVRGLIGTKSRKICREGKRGGGGKERGVEIENEKTKVKDRERKERWSCREGCQGSDGKNKRQNGGKEK